MKTEAQSGADAQSLEQFSRTVNFCADCSGKSHLFQNDSSLVIVRTLLLMKSSFGKILATPETPPGAWVGLEKPTMLAVLVVRVVGVQDVVEVVEVMN